MTPRLHLVTDDAVLMAPDFSDVADNVLARGGRDVALHVRGPGMTGRRLFEIAERCAALCQASGAWLIVNDRIDIVLAVGAAGVQLGDRSLGVRDARALLGPRAVIGRSVHDSDDAQRAFSDGADFVLRGTIHQSASHPGRAPAGLAALRECVRVSTGPVIAIGGITAGGVAAVAAAGAHGVAVLGGVWHAGDPAAAADAYVAAVHGAWPGREEA
ncbi:hypothetical protein BH23GEM10_BH23GEM10_03800 [soil metagenome]